MRLIGLFAGLALLPGLAFGTADGPDAWRVTGVASDDVLNMRAGPSARTAKVARIPHNADGLPNYGCVGRLSIDEWSKASVAERARARKRVWCLTGYKQSFGWVAGWFLREGSPDADAFNAGAWAQTLPRGKWVLSRLGRDPVPAREKPYLELYPSQKMSGFTGCDRFGGGYSTRSGLRLFIASMATRNKCVAAARSIDKRFRRVLDRTAGWIATSRILSVMDSDKRIIATFVRRR